MSLDCKDSVSQTQTDETKREFLHTGLSKETVSASLLSEPSSSSQFLVPLHECWFAVTELTHPLRTLPMGSSLVCSSAESHQVTLASHLSHCSCARRSDSTHKIQHIAPGQKLPGQRGLAGLHLPRTACHLHLKRWGYVFSFLWKRAVILFLDPIARISTPPPKLHGSKDYSHTGEVVLGHR